MDPRHLQRIKTVQNLYALSFAKGDQNLPFRADDKTHKVQKHLKEIDLAIYKYAKKFPLDRIAKTDLAILRVSVFELIIEKKLPEKVVINEAVELAKELSSDKSFGFINAILGKILESQLQA